ncbi:MFS transporter [Hymenobacter sp. BT770]|uniref:MFS transporter n=1 Tax=Hymenobacter sp. BT770 TaxID=2886942 RepID=UPI001D11B3BE|nr:MFS transporter [Hymenobacter sp. BT770]MCC3154793.1 MFS transporter [Hymenobacter sp. BT770]MDO3416490.1 MFS transporter [Hymenobacter sp. BT770]
MPASSLFAPFRSLRNPVFARLYAAQTTSLLGDALTWVGLALLAFELGGSHSAQILAFALTLRVTAFVLLAPLAGLLADRLNRKTIMVTADIVRMVIIGLLPFVTEVWQVYVLMFTVNAFTAFFTPTFQATLPAVTTADEMPQALSLSSATNELLGVLGPGIAGAVAAFLGTRDIFYIDAATFLISGILIFTLPARLRNEEASVNDDERVTVAAVLEGTRLLWRNAVMRYALLLELVAAVSGALILVNTVGLVRGQLHLPEAQYGWVMAAFGIGATAAALLAGALTRRIAHTTFLILGAVLTSLAVLPANHAGLWPLMGLWLLAGAGQNAVNLATQTLIAEQTDTAHQGRVYGAHFAWSHLWWAFAYPLAGFLGTRFATGSFRYGGLVAVALLAGTWLLARRPAEPASPHPAVSSH